MAPRSCHGSVGHWRGRRTRLGPASSAHRSLALQLALVAVASAQPVGYVPPSDFVLSRYTDRFCTPSKFTGGQGSQQSWKRISSLETTANNNYCYDLTSGLVCVFRCHIRIGCDYYTGSGVIVEDMVDQNCVGEVNHRYSLFGHLSWPQANAFFEGACTRAPDGGWMQLDQPFAPDSWPNCSLFGNTGSGTGPSLYGTSYEMQFYADPICNNRYNVTPDGMIQSSKFQFKKYRAGGYCYDYLDITPRNPNISTRVVDQNILNFKIICKNSDANGNGYMIQRYAGAACTGRTEQPEYWRSAFYPMNFPRISKLWNGECTPWGTFWVQMDRPWDKEDFPDCTDWACKSGPCSGGRVGAAEYNGIYRGPITQAVAPATTSDAQRRSHSVAWQLAAVASAAGAVMASLLAAPWL